MDNNLATKLLLDCNAAEEVSNYATEIRKHEVDYKLISKYRRVENIRNEIQIMKEEISEELNGLEPFELRIEKTTNSLEYPQKIALKCFELRKYKEGRSVILDFVDKELKEEISLLTISKEQFGDLLTNVKEHNRKYRASIYSLCNNLKMKDKALLIEKQNIDLRLSDPLLENYYCQDNLYRRSPSHSENWEAEAYKILGTCKHLLHTGRELKQKADRNLKQVVESVMRKYNECNKSLEECIFKRKKSKEALELQRHELSDQITSVKRKIEELQNSVLNKKPYMALATARLNNRVKHNGTELQGDEVELELINEITNLQDTRLELMKNITMAQATLSSLCKSLDEIDKRIKDETDRIRKDEVECQTLRSTVHYHVY